MIMDHDDFKFVTPDFTLHFDIITPGKFSEIIKPGRATADDSSFDYVLKDKRKDNAIVAIVKCRFLKKADLDKSVIWIDMIYVCKPYRHYGVAHHLLDILYKYLTIELRTRIKPFKSPASIQTEDLIALFVNHNFKIAKPNKELDAKYPIMRLPYPRPVNVRAFPILEDALR